MTTKTATTANVRNRHRPGLVEPVFGAAPADLYGGNDISGFPALRVRAIPKAAPRWIEHDGRQAQYWCEGKAGTDLPGPADAFAVYLTEDGAFVVHRWK